MTPSDGEGQRLTRRARQLDELRVLCSSGGTVARAVDLAFEHFAEFGLHDDIVRLLAAAVLAVDASDDLRRRFAELCAARY